MALGAGRRIILAMVMREVFALVLVGAAIGLGLASAITRFIESFLFGLRHNDPLVLAVAVAVLAGAAIVAGYAPALRASRIDPAVALRHE
jgi:ABC-type antimicrobial peptide transport system permease subunit